MLMKHVPLLLGPLEPPGFEVRRSGIRWFREDGQICRAGETLAYCNISLHPLTRSHVSALPFASESRDFQVVLSTRVPGRLRHAPISSSGGFHDKQEFTFPWTGNFAIGSIEPLDAHVQVGMDYTLDLLMLAGRKAYELSEDRTGLMSGYHDRCRAWRSRGDEQISTVLSLGTCELSDVMRGEKSAFLEIFEAIAGSAHFVSFTDTPMVLSARILGEQIRRTPNDFAVIAEDVRRTLACGSVALTPADWMFAAAVLQALQKSPINDSYDVLARNQLQRVSVPQAIILSINSDLGPSVEHRRLGYAYRCHAFRYRYAGPAVLNWLKENFVEIPYDVYSIQRDYLKLIKSIRDAFPETQILVLNAMSTSGADDFQSYDGFDLPLGKTISTVRVKELNLMLHDISRETGIAIVDADAIAADLGGGYCIPDGIHHNGRMQKELREEILRILRIRGIPGMSPTAIN